MSDEAKPSTSKWNFNLDDLTETSLPGSQENNDGLSPSQKTMSDEPKQSSSNNWNFNFDDSSESSLPASQESTEGRSPAKKKLKINNEDTDSVSTEELLPPVHIFKNDSAIWVAYYKYKKGPSEEELLRLKSLPEDITLSFGGGHLVIDVHRDVLLHLEFYRKRIEKLLPGHRFVNAVTDCISVYKNCPVIPYLLKQFLYGEKVYMTEDVLRKMELLLFDIGVDRDEDIESNPLPLPAGYNLQCPPYWPGEPRPAWIDELEQREKREKFLSSFFRCKCRQCKLTESGLPPDGPCQNTCGNKVNKNQQD